MEAEPLDLKLSDEEINSVENRTAPTIPRDEINDDDIYNRAIADCATAKAAWGIVEWLDKEGVWHAIEKAHLTLARHLEAQGIQKPTE